jgi:uncharacterized membrane protein
MRPRFNFAPVSSAESDLLRFASGYFLLNGLVYGLLAAVLLVGYILGQDVSAPPILVFFGVLIQAITAVGLVWTGSLLGRRARLGGFLALGFLLLPIAFTAMSREPMDVTEIVFGVLGVIVLLIIWHELK